MKANLPSIIMLTLAGLSLVGCVEQKHGVTNGLSVTTSQPVVKAKIGDDQKAKTIINHNEIYNHGMRWWQVVAVSLLSGSSVLFFPKLGNYVKGKVWKSSSPC